MSSQSFAVSFARETWALYGVGMVAVTLRCVARVRRLSLRGLQMDDYIMLFGSFCYTILCISLNEVASGGGSNLMTQEEIDTLTPKIKKERIIGSKWVFVSEHAMVLTIWSLKFCMLIIYGRITAGLKQRRLVIGCALYTAIAFVGTELALFLSCRPLSQYWAVPTSNYQCSSYQHYEIAQGSFSISSDIVILVVAMPLLMTVRLPRRQKAILLGIFGLGVFVIIAAILTKIYCLVPSLISYVYMNWYFREATVAMLVVNLPLTWSLFREIPKLRSWLGSTLPSRKVYTKGTGGAYGPQSAAKSQQFHMHSLGLKETKGAVSVSSSQERINSSEDEAPVLSHHIRQDVTFTIEHEDDEEQGAQRPRGGWTGSTAQAFSNRATRTS